MLFPSGNVDGRVGCGGKAEEFLGEPPIIVYQSVGQGVIIPS